MPVSDPLPLVELEDPDWDLKQGELDLSEWSEEEDQEAETETDAEPVEEEG